MFLTTLWLIYVQAFVIGHFCQFCSAVGDRNDNPDCAGRNRLASEAWSDKLGPVFDEARIQKCFLQADWILAAVPFAVFFGLWTVYGQGCDRYSQ